MATVTIGPIGDMRQVRCPLDPQQVTHSREAHATQLLGGAVVVQIPPADRRQWTWNLSWATAGHLVYLRELEAGLHGREYYWMDPIALETNMLSSAASMPGTEPAHGWSDGSVASPGVLQPDGTAESPAVPALPGRTYTAAAHNADPVENLTLSLVRYNAAGALIHTAGPAQVGPGQRAVMTSTAPAGTATQALRVSSALASRPQLTETPDPVDWVPGVGVPRVVLTGVAEAYRRAVRGETREDWSATLIEAG